MQSIIHKYWQSLLEAGNTSRDICSACHSFMNYDRALMKNIGGSLTVLESQSNSGKPYCRLAIRKLEDSTDDLIPAHLK